MSNYFDQPTKTFLVVVKQVSSWQLTTASLVAALGCWASPANAQIQGLPTTSPQYLGTSVSGNISDGYVITNGTQRGKNLFHAFSQFNLNGGSATFDGSGTSGIQAIYGRIHQTTPSNLNGLLRLQNWDNQANPELMLMNPFGFIVGTNFSSYGITSFALLATDALAFQDQDGHVFPFDMSINSSQMSVNPPNWVDADFVGAVMDSSYPDGQGGAPIQVDGSIAIQELGLVGSQLDINGELYSNKLRLYAQDYVGAFYSPPASTIGDGYESGYLDAVNLSFVPYTNAADVGGVADINQFASTQGELTNANGFGSCNASSCPGMVRFGSTASVQPFDGGEQGQMLIAGRQTVIEASNGMNPLANSTLIQFTPYLGGGIYNDLISFSKSSSSASNSISDSSGGSSSSPVEIDSGLTAGEVLEVAPNAPLTAAMDASVTATIDSGLTGGTFSLDTSAVNTDVGGSGSGDSGSAMATRSTGSAISGPPQSQLLTSAETSASFKSAEMATAEKVSAALGLDGAFGDAKTLSTTDLKSFLQSAIEDVRREQLKRISGFESSNYNPAVLHVRYLSEAEAPNTPPDQVTLELILVTAEGDPIGLRAALDRQKLSSALRELYGSLSTQQPLNAKSPGSPSRVLYQQLFAALDPVLSERAVSTLLLSADQGLQAVPYAALHDGEQFLGERFGLALTPSLTLTPLAQPRINSGAILALGASHFQDLAPLPLVPAELQGVVRNQPSEVLLNQAFTPDSLLNAAANPRYRRVHVATHAEFLPGGPAESWLHTGMGPLSLQAFRGLRDRRPGASLDLISLSACRTALGDSDSELGFAGLALQAGSRSAIGSLWYVDDVATSAFFVQLYRYLDAGVPKAEALQLTRQAFARGLVRLEGDVILGVDDQELIGGLDASQRNLASSGLSHPYFWAGIQLLGSPW